MKFTFLGSPVLEIAESTLYLAYRTSAGVDIVAKSNQAVQASVTGTFTCMSFNYYGLFLGTTTKVWLLENADIATGGDQTGSLISKYSAITTPSLQSSYITGLAGNSTSLLVVTPAGITYIYTTTTSLKSQIDGVGFSKAVIKDDVIYLYSGDTLFSGPVPTDWTATWNLGQFFRYKGILGAELASISHPQDGLLIHGSQYGDYSISVDQNIVKFYSIINDVITEKTVTSQPQNYMYRVRVATDVGIVAVGSSYAVYIFKIEGDQLVYKTSITTGLQTKFDISKDGTHIWLSRTINEIQLKILNLTDYSYTSHTLSDSWAQSNNFVRVSPIDPEFVVLGSPTQRLKRFEVNAGVISLLGYTDDFYGGMHEFSLDGKYLISFPFDSISKPQAVVYEVVGRTLTKVDEIENFTGSSYYNTVYGMACLRSLPEQLFMTYHARYDNGERYKSLFTFEDGAVREIEFTDDSRFGTDTATLPKDGRGDNGYFCYEGYDSNAWHKRIDATEYVPDFTLINCIDIGEKYIFVGTDAGIRAFKKITNVGRLYTTKAFEAITIPVVGTEQNITSLKLHDSSDIGYGQLQYGTDGSNGELNFVDLAGI